MSPDRELCTWLKSLPIRFEYLLDDLESAYQSRNCDSFSEKKQFGVFMLRNAAPRKKLNKFEDEDLPALDQEI